jgi:hypothetical protein
VKGLNGFNGAVLREIFPHGEITRGQTYPVTIILKENGTPVVVTGYQMLISFDDTLACVDGGTPLYVYEVPITDDQNGTFSGLIPDDATFGLPMGNIYVSIKYIDLAGNTFIQDMVRTKVSSCVNPTRD